MTSAPHKPQKHMPARPVPPQPGSAQARKRSVAGALIGLSLLELAGSDKMITAYGVTLALGSTTFAISMVYRNVQDHERAPQPHDYSYDVLYWKQPIVSALPVQKPEITASAAPSVALDLTPLGTVSAKPTPESAGKVEGYSLVIAGKGTAVLEGRRGFTEVRVGSHLDGGHEVTAIEQRGTNWVVVTNHGTISALTP